MFPLGIDDTFSVNFCYYSKFPQKVELVLSVVVYYFLEVVFYVIAVEGVLPEAAYYFLYFLVCKLLENEDCFFLKGSILDQFAWIDDYGVIQVDQADVIVL